MSWPPLVTIGMENEASNRLSLDCSVIPSGTPLSIEVFAGNTQDTKTFGHAGSQSSRAFRRRRGDLCR